MKYAPLLRKVLKYCLPCGFLLGRQNNCCFRFLAILCVCSGLEWIKSAHAENVQAIQPELVPINVPTSKYALPKTLIHQTVFEPDNSLTVLTSQGERLELWKLGSDSVLYSLSVELGIVGAANILDDDSSVLAASPLNLCLADVKRGNRRQFETQDVVGWPLAGLPNGLCAWTQPNNSGNEVLLSNVKTSFKRSIALESYEMAVDLAISPDGKNLAIALSHNIVDVYPIAKTDQTNISLKLTLPNPLPAFPKPFGALDDLHPRLMFPNFGAANVVKFSPDSKFLL